MTVLHTLAGYYVHTNRWGCNAPSSPSDDPDSSSDILSYFFMDKMSKPARFNRKLRCGVDFDGFTHTKRGDGVCTGRRDRSATPSPPDDLDSSSDVSWCVSKDLMSKPARYYLTPMCEHDFDGFTHTGGGTTYAPVGDTGAQYRGLLMI